jgi:hypothetical protein
VEPVLSTAQWQRETKQHCKPTSQKPYAYKEEFRILKIARNGIFSDTYFST